MSREIDVDELLDMIKTGKIDEYLVEINEGEELDYEDDLSSLRWIKNNIHIKPDQKEKMKEAIFNDEYDPVIMSWFEAAMLDKNEIKTLINGKNGLNNEIYTFFIVATGDIEEYLTDDKIEELGLDSYDIKELIEETENIEKYLTTGNVQKWGLDPYQIKPLIEKTGNIEKYLTADKMQEFGFDSYDITELIVKTGKIEDYLTEDKIQEWGLNSPNICRLISITGNIEKYLTTGNVQKWGLNSKEVLNLITNNLNDSNIHLIYDLGFNHTNIESCEILHKNLDYILKKEKQTEKKEIIKKLYEKNNDIVKVKFEILDNKYLQTLGEDKINQISCYPEQVDDILTLNEKELRLLGRCLDLYEGEDWTPLCKRILGNIGTILNYLKQLIILMKCRAKILKT